MTGAVAVGSAVIGDDDGGGGGGDVQGSLEMQKLTCNDFCFYNTP